jgi:hypothetical protein
VSYASKVLQAIEHYRPILNQLQIAVQQRDKRIDGLIEMMASIYHIILESEPLEKFKSFARTIEGVLLPRERG